MERNLRPLEESANCDRELLTAGVALVGPRPVGFALHGRGIPFDAAVRADWTIRPMEGFKEAPGFFGAVEDCIVWLEVHVSYLLQGNYIKLPILCFVKYTAICVSY